MQTPTAGNATIRLWGHGRLPAMLDVERYPTWAWIARIVLFLICWVGGTLLTLIFTFDPFIASFPFVLGLALVYNGFMGRYRVRAFAGSCPRCNGELKLEPGSKINLPHQLDCFACHFEPELHLDPC